jgi:hypothetical protein
MMQPFSYANLREHLTRLVVLAIAAPLLLSGCLGAAVEVPATFPIPVVQKVPRTVGIHLDEHLTTYIHRERLENMGDWEINLGPSQTAMFGNLATGLFEGFQWVDDPSVPHPNLSAVLYPTLEELQFSIPDQTRSDYFEVWIRYHIRMFDNQGVLLGEWPLTAYGKANEQNYGLTSDEPALQQAALAACRDAMAFFTIQFRSMPVVKEWLGAPTAGVVQ